MECNKKEDDENADEEELLSKLQVCETRTFVWYNSKNFSVSILLCLSNILPHMQAF